MTILMPNHGNNGSIYRMKQAMMLRLGLLLAISLGFASGCTFVDIREEISYGSQDQMIPEQVIEQIKPGETSEQWIMDNLGTPSQINTESDGSVTYVFRFV